MFAVYKVPA